MYLSRVIYLKIWLNFIEIKFLKCYNSKNSDFCTNGPSLKETCSLKRFLAYLDTTSWSWDIIV